MSVEEQHEEGSGDRMLQGMGEGPQIVIKETQCGKLTDTGLNITICPMCHGKGYYEEVGKPELSFMKDENSERKPKVLPSIKTEQQPQSFKLEQIYKAKEHNSLSRVSDSALQNTMKPKTRLPPLNLNRLQSRHAFSTVGKPASSPQSRNFPALASLLPEPMRPEKNPQDVARLAVIKLNRDDWDTKKAGLEDCLQLAHFNPEELEHIMGIVYRTMSAVLNTFRPNYTLFACQAACQFFARMRSTCRPEFDELVYALLNRTADSNRYIRMYANDALDKMVTYIPTVLAVRPIVEKGPGHNNPLVRTATARLLTCIVALKSPNTILTHPNLRDTCKRILDTAALLIADSNIDCRATAKKLFQRFLNEEEFEAIYYAEVDEKLRKRISRTFVELKYKKQMQV